MRTFNFFQCNKFPSFEESKTISYKEHDGKLFGENVREYTIKNINAGYSNGLIYTEVSHFVDYNISGETFTLVGNKFEKVPFRSFYQPITFPMYYSEDSALAILQVKKKVGQDFYKKAIKNSWFPELEIIEREVDFGKLEPLIDEYKSVWFSGMGGSLSSANLTGTNLKVHPHFIDYQETGGHITNVTVPFVYKGAEHRVMISKNSSVTLQQVYDNIPLELEIALNVTNTILKKSWKDIQVPEDKEHETDDDDIETSLESE